MRKAKQKAQQKRLAAKKIKADLKKRQKDARLARRAARDAHA